MIPNAGALCGDPTCEICPTQSDLDAWHDQQQANARDIVRYLLGLSPNDGSVTL